MNRQRTGKDRGATLIILIIVIAFLLAVGILVLYITGTGPEVAGNLRLQEQAFNAAEAGFDNAWTQIEGSFVGAGWTNFEGHYITTQVGISDPFDSILFCIGTVQTGDSATTARLEIELAVQMPGT